MNKIIYALLFSSVVCHPLICLGDGQEQPAAPTNYEECVEQGHKVIQTFPPSCVTPDGKTFQQEMKRPQETDGGKGFCKDLCGDGQCQEIVCMGQGCPCAESKERCPQDCQG